MRVEGTGGIRSIAVLVSGGHFSMSELHVPRSRCIETMSQTFTDSEDIDIYILTAIGLSPGGSTHLHTNNTQNNINNNQTTQIQTNVLESGPCPVFASFTLAFALQLRKKHGKTSVRVRKTSVRLRKTSVTVQHIYYQKHPHTIQPSQTHTLQNPLIHTLQKNIKPPLVQIKTKCI
jgi:hypothetical protein